MPLHIDEIQTDVQVEASASGNPPAAAQPVWQQLAQLRGLRDRLLDDGERTAAHGNED